MQVAVLWDMNGIIIDDMQFHLESFQGFLREYGHDMTEEFLRTRCVGAPPTEVFADVLPEIGNPVSIEEAVSRKREIYFELIKGKMKMLPGVSTLIEDLRKRGIKQAVASGATKIEVEAILKEFGIREIFGAVVACEDVSRGKPDPEPFVAAAELLGADPKYCVVIEDGEYGVRAAKSVGMKAVAVLNTQTREELAAADIITESLETVDAETVISLFREPERV